MNENELRVTAELAEIELGEAEFAALAEAVSEMVGYFETMLEADVEALEPTTHALLRRNRTRPDNAPTDSDPELDVDALLENAPELEDRFIVIPNVL